MNKAALLLGSNLNNRLDLINRAVSEIESNIGKLISKSSIYETPPWGFESKNSFLNQVVIIDTSLSPQDVLDLCLTIEQQMGRTRKETQGYADRTIDLDILLYNEDIIETEKLTVPHPRMQNRLFCLIPLNEVAPLWNVPTFSLTIGELLAECKDETVVKPFDVTI